MAANASVTPSPSAALPAGGIGLGDEPEVPHPSDRDPLAGRRGGTSDRSAASARASAARPAGRLRGDLLARDAHSCARLVLDSLRKSIRSVHERAFRYTVRHAPGGTTQRRSSTELSSDGERGGRRTRERLDVSAATIRRDLELLEATAPADAHPRRRGGRGRAVRAAAPIQGRAPPRGEAADRRGGGGARHRRRGGRAHRRHHHDRGRARGGRPRAPDGRHERPQHRERARRAAQPEAGRDRRLPRARSPTSWSGRSPSSRSPG